MPNQKDLKSLIKEWNKKLKESGFQDIEGTTRGGFVERIRQEKIGAIPITKFHLLINQFDNLVNHPKFEQLVSTQLERKIIDDYRFTGYQSQTARNLNISWSKVFGCLQRYKPIAEELWKEEPEEEEEDDDPSNFPKRVIKCYFN